MPTAPRPPFAHCGGKDTPAAAIVDLLPENCRYVVVAPEQTVPQIIECRRRGERNG